MPDAYEALSTLRLKLISDREQIKERIVSSRNREEQTREAMIGECIGLKHAIDAIHQQIRSINGDTDEKQPL